MLLEFQRDFAAAISSSEEGPMRVYRNTVFSGCVEALRDNYQVVARLLGDEMFDHIAAEYAVISPPLRPVLALYGSSFPDWLEVQSWVADLRYLPDVARIERLQIEALFAADAEPLDMAALQGHDDWQNLQLPLHPAARFSWSITPSFSIWRSQCEQAEGELEFEWQAEGVLITRPALEVQAIPLNRAAHRFLFGVRLGETVGAAAISAASLYPGTDIGSLFTSLVNAGTFAGSSHRSLS